MTIKLTFNLKDFPKQELIKFGIFALHPDVFLEDLLIKKTLSFLEAIEQQIKLLQRPKITNFDFINLLEKSKLINTANRLKTLTW